MSDGEGCAARRRRRSRSRHHRKRRHSTPAAEAQAREEAAPERRSPLDPPGGVAVGYPPAHAAPPARGHWAVEYPPFGAATQWRAGRGNGPPLGWHGSSGGGPPPPAFAYPGPLPGPADSPPPRHLQGYGAAPPDVRYEVIREGPYGGSPFGGAAVPPPPGLDDGLRGGRGRWKGKGRGGGGPPDADEARVSLPDGLVVSSIPPELCTLSVLNRHFRQFGEVLRITVQADEGKAFVQFAEHAAAVAALPVPVLERSDIVLSRAPRPFKGKGGKGKDGKGKNKDAAGSTENRVFHANPEELKKIDEAKKKRDDFTVRKAKLLGSLTEQLKAVMSKLNDDKLSEAKKDALKGMLTSIKAKMDTLNSPGMGVVVSEDGVQGSPAQASTPSKQKGKASGKGGQYTLDLRSKVLRVNIIEGWTQDRLREELRKFDITDEQVVDILWQTGDDGATNSESSLIRFRERWVAEKLFNRKSELPFTVEWCESQSLPALPVTSPTLSPALTPTPAPADTASVVRELSSAMAAVAAEEDNTPAAEAAPKSAVAQSVTEALAATENAAKTPPAGTAPAADEETEAPHWADGAEDVATA